MSSKAIYQNYIHGKYQSNGTGETFEVTNPATGKVSYLVEVATESVQQAAIDSAKVGFAIWSAMAPIECSRILFKAVALLREQNDELAAGEVLDTGKPWQDDLVN
jgi:betaine-aldehyde dehydrogenase